MTEEEFRAAVCAEVVRLLTRERKARGLSMNQLAKKAGLTQPMISIIESSQPNPKLDSLLRISRALDVDLGSILSRAVKNIETGSAKRSRSDPPP